MGKTCIAVFLKAVVILFFIGPLVGCKGSKPSDTDLFSEPAYYPSTGWLQAVALGDLENDGRDEIVVISNPFLMPGYEADEDQIHIFKYSKNALHEVATIPVPSENSGPSQGITTVQVADVNSDGKNDIIVGYEWDGITVLISATSTCRWTRRTSWEYTSKKYSSTFAYQIATGDFNNDGRIDVAAIDVDGDTIQVLYQDAGGNLDDPVAYPARYSFSHGIKTGDLNSDGLTDIAVLSGMGSEDIMCVLIQKPGGFDTPRYYSSDKVRSGAGTLGIGDFTGDGRDDMVLASAGNAPYTFIETFVQGNDGALSGPTAYTSYEVPYLIEVADVNGDGLKDIIVEHQSWHKMGIYIQAPDHTLKPEVLYDALYGTISNPQGMLIGDINGDGRAEIVVANISHSSLDVLWGQ